MNPIDNGHVTTSMKPLGPHAAVVCAPGSLSRFKAVSKVVIGHPKLGRGGSEAAVMWLIEALKQDFDVTVVTTGGWDLDALNDFYGTQVQREDVTVRIAPVPFPIHKLSAAAFRGACYQRFAARIASEYDLRISAYNPTDWGLPAVHFIADFSWSRELREKLDPETPGLIYRKSLLRWAYLKTAEQYGAPTGRDVLREDVIIANSNWTAAIMAEQFGVRCARIVYPPVWTEFPEVPWELKEEGFVMIGRIAPEKRIEHAIAILEAVRHRGHHICLHLCGRIDDSPYGRHIAQLCRDRTDWIVLEGQVAGKRKAQILASYRYGIQMRAAEPFGISVAEMVKAGAIVFAPNDGGQTEILKQDDLLFLDETEAVAKICRVLLSPGKQHSLRSHLYTRASMFTSIEFVNSCRSEIGRVTKFGKIDAVKRLTSRPNE